MLIYIQKSLSHRKLSLIPETFLSIIPNWSSACGLAVKSLGRQRGT